MMNSIEKLDRQIEMLSSKKFRERTTIKDSFQPVIQKKKKVILEEPTKMDIMADLLPDNEEETIVYGMKEAIDDVDVIKFDKVENVHNTTNYNILDIITSKYSELKQWVIDYVNTGDLDEKICDLLSIFVGMAIIFMILFTIIL